MAMKKKAPGAFASGQNTRHDTTDRAMHETHRRGMSPNQGKRPPAKIKRTPGHPNRPVSTGY